jgi:hypothetical protein
VRRRRPTVFLGKVWLLAMVIRLALWLLPFGAVQRLTRHWGRQSARAGVGRRRDPDVLAAAVRYATRYVPRASCLTQALVAQVLLSRSGYAPALRIGLARGPGGALNAHAWLENEGEVVLGGGTTARFTALRDPDPR